MPTINSDIRKFVLSELSRLGRSYNIVRDSAMITCPYHRPGQNNSWKNNFSINLKEHKHNNKVVPIGFWRCWSCRVAGSWNKLKQDK